MAKKTPPRKMRNIKAAASASSAASVELANSNCSFDVTLQEVTNYELFGYGKTGQTYTAGEVTNFASDEDKALQVTGKGANGQLVNIKDTNNLISGSIAAGLSTNGANNYFATTGQGLTGSGIVNFIYDQSGPQVGYIPQLVHGSQGLSAGQEYVFFLPSTVTGAAGANMPANHSRSFQVTIAGAVAPGESIQVYTASAHFTHAATGSAFTYSASFCSSPNYATQSMFIPTASLLGVAGAGIVVAYTSSYASADNKENTPYAGVVVTINPSALV